MKIMGTAQQQTGTNSSNRFWKQPYRETVNGGIKYKERKENRNKNVFCLINVLARLLYLLSRVMVNLSKCTFASFY